MKNNEIAKSSLLIQKERELKELQKKKTKVIASIKTTKSKLTQLKEDVERVSKEMFNGLARLGDLSKLAKELKILSKELMKKVKLNPRDKRDLNEMLSVATLDDISENVDAMFEEKGFDGFNPNEPQDTEQFTDEFNRQRVNDMFGKFTVKVDEKEQQQIRKVFLELANRFHPDKASGEQELKLFNDLMQSINGAYQSGDLDELLDIKERFKAYQTSDASTDYDIPILDALESQLLKQRNELTLLENQLNRLKEELKNLKDSELGDLVKTNKQATKQGAGDAAQFSDGTQQLFEMLEEMKKMMTEWMETGKKPKTFSQFADGSHPLVQKMNASNMYDMSDDEDELSEEEMQELWTMLRMAQEMDVKPKQARRRR
jgi:hypothetical protein